MLALLRPELQPFVSCHVIAGNQPLLLTTEPSLHPPVFMCFGYTNDTTVHSGCFLQVEVYINVLDSKVLGLIFFFF